MPTVLCEVVATQRGQSISTSRTWKAKFFATRASPVPSVVGGSFVVQFFPTAPHQMSTVSGSSDAASDGVAQEAAGAGPVPGPQAPQGTAAQADGSRVRPQRHLAVSCRGAPAARTARHTLCIPAAAELRLFAPCRP